eukprot:CAMPEP_0172538824 /NCGR_PEP_ID=MMETSP1067-20121228/10140_1 /TAXON_ID=265564 ORGANISM="Thalassiosira punctigera, Strain Tpunct2005C2" /NCGR_SAMPLE_ID=MMETSP1067 /ASSEMBLY_ACC=CAM_ASM_000444 /LENGTH=480 /DNA_ID=CAMNT_0013324399 /DNA_START=123 /DNA_END=1564 /DNA_ORIENTATION=+
MTTSVASRMNNVHLVHRMEAAISRQWKSLPKEAREFLLETPLESLVLQRFAEFWSSPSGIEYAWSSGLKKSVRDASLSMALNYLYLGQPREARALMLNGLFMLECMNSGIDRIAIWCRENPNAPCPSWLIHFGHAFHSVKTPVAMEELLKGGVGKFVGQIANDCGYSTERKRNSSSEASPGSQIQLVIADDARTDERQTLNIGSSTTLKTLFNEYSEKRGVSLRSLRFTHGGKTLFLSNAGKRTPDELDMKDGDVINVCDANHLARETSGGGGTKKEKAAAPKQHAIKHNNSRKGRKGGKTKKMQLKQKEAVKTEDHMARHSTMLTRLHEEMQPQLKRIRTRLNALDLQRQPSKQKRHLKKKDTKQDVEWRTRLPCPGVGGKAGRPRFDVQVGGGPKFVQDDQAVVATSDPTDVRVVVVVDVGPARVHEGRGARQARRTPGVVGGLRHAGVVPVRDIGEDRVRLRRPGALGGGREVDTGT